MGSPEHLHLNRGEQPGPAVVLHSDKHTLLTLLTGQLDGRARPHSVGLTVQLKPVQVNVLTQLVFILLLPNYLQHGAPTSLVRPLIRRHH